MKQVQRKPGNTAHTLVRSAFQLASLQPALGARALAAEILPGEFKHLWSESGDEAWSTHRSFRSKHWSAFNGVKVIRHRCNWFAVRVSACLFDEWFVRDAKTKNESVIKCSAQTSSAVRGGHSVSCPD